MANSELSYQNRPLTVKLSDKNYIVTKLIGEESVSDGCEFSLSIVSNSEIDIKNLAKVVSVTYRYAPKKERLFTGLCHSLQLSGYSSEKKQYYYQVEMVDPLKLLAYRRSRKVFQNMTTKQIIEKLIAETELKTYFTFSISGCGKEHEYCVQLDETDLMFIHRLLASEGWHFHVCHQSGKPNIVIGDSNQRFKKINNSTLTYQKEGSQSGRGPVTWSQSHTVGTGKVSIADYTQILAETFNSGDRKSVKGFAPESFSVGLFAYGFENKDEVSMAAKRHMEALDLKKCASHSSSGIAELACGYKFKLENHPAKSMNQEYVILGISHQLSCEESLNDTTYTNQFTCIPSALAFRSELREKPRVHSLHTATVTGPSGEEIYCDKMGRVKVQFHWDSQGKKDENSSCWLPVSQSFASKGFGAQFTPRVGDEVLVQYIDGDPDRPVITGSLYNKLHAVPYRSSSQSGIKTRSTPKGSSEQGNELRFEDQKDKEQIFLHAEKDWVVDVNNDSQATIKGMKTTKVEKSVSLFAKEDISLESEKQLTTKSKGNWIGNSCKDLTLKADSNIKMSAAKDACIDASKVVISATNKIELKVGASKIEITTSGVKIDAPQVLIKGKAKAEMKAAMVNVQGDKADINGKLVSVKGSAMTQIKGGAMVQIKGGITKVN
ncbi:type VI secretion system tip protein VgrG [Vibrio pectenicida]|uniref:Type VI secretion system tip protein VgrG n=1 Tax=Vibrio pectenicida TaxID=62763 RepID=A0A7Y3ZY77_9VIBR|nr:type VI secretion system tip protein TssI/VgrG [Vibrio pectenicida]NOH70364.1 type VI secretion system tip protein VgrG [Vibrio pectenicida]